MHRFIAPKMKNMKPSSLGHIWDRAAVLERQGKEIFHFEIGRPDFDTPAPIKAAAVKALDQGKVHYTVPRGIIELREAIAADLEKRLGVSYDPEKEITVTIGGVEGITDIMITLLEKGDQILSPDPMYLFYLEWGAFAEAETVSLPTRAGEEFQITEEALSAKVTDRTKIVIVNSPHNPTGTGLSDQSLEALAKTAREKDLLVISDEVYDRITYAPFKHRSIASLPGMKERTMIVNSFSKPFAMDGWRIGYMAGPAELIEELDKAHLRSSTCANTLAQWAALEALRLGDELVEPMLARYTARRKLVLDMIEAAPGLSAFRPKGAFYIWVDYGEIGMETDRVALELLEKGGVALTPGTAFGPQGENHLRISYAAGSRELEGGIPRMIETLNRLKG